MFFFPFTSLAKRPLVWQVASGQLMLKTKNMASDVFSALRLIRHDGFWTYPYEGTESLGGEVLRTPARIPSLEV